MASETTSEGAKASGAKPKPNRSLAQAAAAVVLGALVAWAASSGAQTVAGVGIHWWIAALAFAVNWIAYVPAYLKQTEHFYDLVGSLTYLTTTLAALVLAAEVDGRSLLIAFLVAVWASRLGFFLFQRVRTAGKDGRFDRLKTSPTRFFMTWTVQGLWVVFTAAAAHAAIGSAERVPLGIWAMIGTAIWFVGFAIEAISDQQKKVFKDDPANKGRYITSGLWAWSRHPNYFGEITLWVGMAIIAIPVLSGWQYVTLLSPVFVFLLLTKVSGLPMLEHRADKRWGDEAEYQQYKAQTPVLVPRPPRSA